MEHTIILASASQNSLIPLMESSQMLLNKSIRKIFKVFYLEELLQVDGVTAGVSTQNEIDSLVSKVENEMLVERYAKDHNYKVEILRDIEDEFTILSQSSVADLIVLELNDEIFLHDRQLLSLFLEKVDCPVLILPKDFSLECLVAVHDASKSSVKALKEFLKLFDESLTKKPLSLLMEEPESSLEIKRERVFINYLRLFFEDMGAQHIHDESLESLLDFVGKECEKPMLVIDTNLGLQILKSPRHVIDGVLKYLVFISKG